MDTVKKYQILKETSREYGIDSKSDLSLAFEGALCDRNAALFTNSVKVPIPP